MFSFIPVAFLPLVIFISRILDVSLGTIRIVMVSRGYKTKAAVLGFFEVLIWAIVVSELLNNLDNWINFVAYAGGFATGNYVGLILEDKLKVGTVIARVITRDKRHELVEDLKERGFIVTIINAHGGFTPVDVIFTVLRRKRLEEFVNVIRIHDPEAFYSIEDVKYASSDGTLPGPKKKKKYSSRILGLRKGF